MNLSRILPFTLLFFSLLIIPGAVFAQGANLNMANTYELDIEGMQDGDIISINQETGEYILAQSGLEQPTELFGIIVEDAPLVYRTSETGTPVVRAGEVYLNVSTLGGEIKKGDFIATSKLPGKGKKMTETVEDIVGVAVEGFDGSEGEEVNVEGENVKVGIALVSLRLVSGYDEQREGFRKVASLYLGELGLSALDVFSSQQGTEMFIRYIIAALIVLLSLVLTFRFLGRNIINSMQSMGRNPLAGRKIQTMIVLNVALIAGINIGAIIVALFIVRF